ncbi:MAG: DUF882 domain-containing protein [Methylicorpusculum sp.]|uniref:YcbK family protein n=1 Tax=Methylicorpusculum sp. TaxID=2713644 RepID=UPI00271A769A|nr:DUF882 domain-containing protein [Methylicorpusculum sp.]MDO8843950.1 DUF882 domain-containing protein [Methylicorpusculum sp.]MDO8939013.1 DUF882 domain-containing protein [Methylicorpusculum sp.]MDO9238723.1 DUF882 domain-containing protein [Methylicorpusculum sp.]MDP2179330.1 DUF882 domain-containing protein [Methylicorpusculum sp.]MDP2201835.1 DUF882 domain-containing protein [Methylicorpusculum sp.]
MTKHILENHGHDEDSVVASRRRFLKNMAYGTLLTIGTPVIANASVRRFPVYKTLAFQNMHTGDKLKLTYFEQGRYISEALQEINYLLRDYRSGDVHPIDPALLDQLYDLRMMLGVNKPFNILSAYRSPSTNAILRKQTHGVAKHSLHMQGKAVDIRLPGVDTRKIRNAALAMRQGGVGYYGHSDFVHIDTGDFRTW